MHLSCSMQCWASACSAVPSSRKGGSTTQTMCPLHSKKQVFSNWVNSDVEFTFNCRYPFPKCTCIFSSICKTNKTRHKNMRQLPEIKHAVWFETCWLFMLKTHAKRHPNTKNVLHHLVHIQKVKHSFAVCKWIPNSSFSPKTSINNSSCTKTSCIPKTHQFQMFSHHSASFPQFCSKKPSLTSCWVCHTSYMQERSTSP